MLPLVVCYLSITDLWHNFWAQPLCVRFLSAFFAQPLSILGSCSVMDTPSMLQRLLELRRHLEAVLVDSQIPGYSADIAAIDLTVDPLGLLTEIIEVEERTHY